MLSKLRRFLICLLICAVPWKAVAGVIMLGCGPGHVSGNASQIVAMMEGRAVSHAGHHGVNQEHYSSNPIVHTQSSVSPATTASFAADDDPGLSLKDSTDEFFGKTSHGKAAAGKCGSCAPCCAASAPASELLVRVSCAVSHERWRASDDSLSGVIGDVPHQPPRSFLG